ncbi:hypothetical protein Tco_0363366 [Tanacetum coccineum]
MARIMPPRRFKKKSVKRIVEKRVAKAIEEYEKTRADSNNTGGSGLTNTGGTVAPDVHDVRLTALGLVDSNKRVGRTNKEQLSPAANQRQKLLRYYVAAPAKGGATLANLPWLQ